MELAFGLDVWKCGFVFQAKFALFAFTRQIDAGQCIRPPDEHRTPHLIHLEEVDFGIKSLIKLRNPAGVDSGSPNPAFESSSSVSEEVVRTVRQVGETLVASAAGGPLVEPGQVPTAAGGQRPPAAGRTAEAGLPRERHDQRGEDEHEVRAEVQVDRRRLRHAERTIRLEEERLQHHQRSQQQQPHQVEVETGAGEQVVAAVALRSRWLLIWAENKKVKNLISHLIRPNPSVGFSHGYDSAADGAPGRRSRGRPAPTAV